MKHIRKYEGVNESLGRGSVLFIKGKSEGGKRKLFVTQILGYNEFKPGAVMFFLPKEFYRIEEVDGRLKAKSVGLGDSDLRAVLNLKADGRISIVKNNAKTPWHWKSLKHTNIFSAIQELEDEIKMGDYLLEQRDLEKDDMFYEVYNHIVKKVLSVAFLGEKEPDIIFTEVNVDRSLSREISNASKSQIMEKEWNADLSFLYLGKEYRTVLEELNLSPMIEISLIFKSEAAIKVEYYPGDYHTPPDWDVNVESIQTELIDVYLEGTTESFDTELRGIHGAVEMTIKELDDQEIQSLFKENIKIPEHLKKGE